MSKSVWTVQFYYGGEDTSLVGVFSTKENAESFASSKRTKWVEDVIIRDWEVDVWEF